MACIEDRDYDFFDEDIIRSFFDQRYAVRVRYYAITNDIKI